MASRLIPDFAEADSPLADWSLSLSNQLRARLEDKAAALRVGKGKGSLGDYLRTAARVPGALITNLADSAVSGLTLPGDVYTGKTKVPLVPSSAPEASNELIRRALDLTGTMASGTLAAPRGAIGSGAVRRFKPGDKAVKIGDKVYTDPAMHVGAVEEAALEKGYKSLDEAVDKDPVFEGLDENNFGTIDDKGKFVPDVESKVSHSDMGSVTFEDYMSERSARKYDEDNGSEFFAGGKGSVVPGLAVLSDPFYSHLERVVSKGPASASPEQWLATIKNGGVKGEELEWSGVEKALAGKTGPVSKEELAAMVKGAKPEIKEVVKGGARTFGNRQAAEDVADNHMDMWHEDFEHEHGRPATIDEAAAARQEIIDDVRNNPRDYGAEEEVTGTKFSQYQLPGGENYREVLLTMPETETGINPSKLARQLAEQIDDNWDELGPNGRQRYYDEANRKADTNFRSSHWDEPNVLVHMRLNDRVLGAATPDQLADIGQRMAASLGVKDIKHLGSGAAAAAVRKGAVTPAEAAEYSKSLGWFNEFKDQPGIGKKTLFAEEIQSDWHQKGRKEGYSENPTKGWTAVKEKDPSFGVPMWVVRDAQGKVVGSVSPRFAPTAEEAIAGQAVHSANPVKGVPDAPFKKTWPDLALKRIVREAAEKGYDQVAWTDGATQADRYDLSKHIDRIDYIPSTGTLQAWKGHSAVLDKTDIKPDELPNLIGKEAAEKLLNTESESRGVVKGLRIDGSPQQGYVIIDKSGQSPDWATGVYADRDEALQLIKKNSPGASKDKVHSLSGLDLKVGGEGMKGFYDKILPAQANKLFGKYGAKVERGKVGEDSAQYHVIPSRRDDGFQIQNRQGEDLTGRVFNTREEADTYAQEHLKEYIFNNKTDVHVLPITPELRRAALSEGFPLFSGGVPLPGDPDHRRIRLTPVEHTPTFTEPANGARMSAQPAGNPAGGRVVRLTPVEHDPFAT